MRVSPNIYVLSVSANGYQWYPDGLTKYIFDYYRSVATTMISWWSPLTPLHKWWSHPRYVQTCWFRRGSDPKMRCLLQSGRKISFETSENFWLKYPWQGGVCGRGRVPAEAWGGHAYWRTSKLTIFWYRCSSQINEKKCCRSLTPGRAWTTPLPTSRQTSLPSSSPPTGHLDHLDLPGHSSVTSCRPQNKQSSSSSWGSWPPWSVTSGHLVSDLIHKNKQS